MVGELLEFGIEVVDGWRKLVIVYIDNWLIFEIIDFVCEWIDEGKL